MRYTSSPISIVSAFTLTTFVCASTVIGQDTREPHSPTSSTAAAVPTFVDTAIPSHQRDLLVLAFDVASAIPVNPHVKDRCKLQEEVTAACLASGQPRLALELIPKIDDWRRGAAFADLALYAARNGLPAEVDQYLNMARSIASSADDWRRDLIRSRIARTLVWMGQEQQAAQFTTDLGKPEMAVVESAKAETSDAAEFDARMSALIGSLSSGDFDLMRGALDACVILFDRFYSDEPRREKIEKNIRLYAEQMPVTIRIDLLLELTRIAAEHKDLERATQIATQARSYLYIYGWRAEDKVPYMGRVAAMQWKAGDVEASDAELNAAIALYTAERESIVSIERASALLPLAEAYHAKGQSASALSVYRRALEEAGANPNARPRANDLGAACLSMASIGIEPDEATWQLLRGMRAGLNNPW